ncbi:MAG: CheR family methyltransferase [Spirulinaceae cyanobacterium]
MANPNLAALAAIEALLAQQIGFDAQSFGLKALQNTIVYQQQTLGFADLAAYFHYLKGSPMAQDELIEAVVVPETSFFRNPASFDHLHRHLSIHSDRSAWRILSLPCSTGEEPYSIAITFLEAGVSSQSYLIDAVDISTKALGKAVQGEYRRNSFRPSSKVEPELLQRYFQRQGDRYLIDSDARASVYFHQDNLANMSCLRERPPYDVVFCRNLLIYFHKTARDRALKHLDRLLVPGGLLFVGHAEAQLIDQRRFQPCPAPHAFAFEKRVFEKPVFEKQVLAKRVFEQLPQKSIPQKSIERDLSPRCNSATIAKTTTQRQPPTITAVSATPVESPSELDLDQIRALADRGILDPAKTECDRYLKTHPTDAAAYLLLGEIQQAQGQDDEAESAFQKVLFLNPNCEAALIHLLLHCNQKGDRQAAQRLQQRLNRLHEKQ